MTKKMRSWLWQKCLKEGALLENTSVVGGIILKFIVHEFNERVRTGIFPFRTETSGGLL
jgi:hypothetical protein